MNFNQTGIKVSKAQFAIVYGMTPKDLQYEMNVLHYEKLVAVGYDKRKSTIPPDVLRLLIELLPEPITKESFEKMVFTPRDKNT